MKTSNEAATHQTPVSVEEVIERSLGQMTWNQILQAILASIGPVFDNQQSLISIFTDAQPPWHCTNSTRNHSSCSSFSDICSLSKTDWACSEDKHSAIISDWNLECSSSFIKGLPATSFFLGSFSSGFLLASLGDTSLGRKNLLVISCLTMSLAAFVSAFSPNFWLYCVTRFICGASRVAITICSCVLLPERVGKRWRGQIVLMGFTSLTFGSLSLTAIAYLTRRSSWRTLYIWTSIPAAIYSVVTHFFLLESPRWLFMQGRQTDALNVLGKIGSGLPNSLQIDKPLPDHKGNPFSSVKILLQKKWAAQRLTVTMVLSFGVGMMYLGMFLGVGGLGLDIYLSSILNALIFLLASLITYLFWIQRCNRRSSVLGFCTVSGAASIISSVARLHHKGGHVVLEMVALFCASMAFNILFMYTVELFPTCVRNTAASLSRQALSFASIFVPVLVVIGRRNDEVLSNTIYGVTIVVCGLLVLTLPETKGKVLCDTMEEQEDC